MHSTQVFALLIAATAVVANPIAGVWQRSAHAEAYASSSTHIGSAGYVGTYASDFGPVSNQGTYTGGAADTAVSQRPHTECSSVTDEQEK